MAKAKREGVGLINPGDERYYELFESIRDGVYISTIDGTLIEANQALIDMFGYSRKEFLTMSTTQLYVNIEERAAFQDEMKKKAFVKDYEMEMCRKNGRKFYCQITSTTRKSPEGEIIGYQGIVRDISVQKLMEKAITENEKIFHMLFEGSPDAIMVISHNGIILDANPAACALHNAEWDEMIDRECREFIPDRIRKKFTKDFENIVNGKRSYLETYCLNNKGGEIPVEINTSLIDYASVPAVIMNIRDITKREDAEKALGKERHERLKAVVDAQERERKRISLELHDGLGQILTSVRFKLNTALSGKGLRWKMKQVKEIKSNIDDLILEVRNMSNQLMPSILSDIGLEAALQRFLEETKKVAKGNIEFDTFGLNNRFDPEVEIGIYRIVQEAINNAVKYAKAKEIHVQLVNHDNMIRLMIEDNGVGFNPKTISTPEKRKKLEGNGMNNMKNRAEMLDGEFYLESSPGTGTNITVDIPIK